MARVMLRKGAHKRIQSGHPWLFKTEVETIEGDYSPGDIVDVISGKGRFLGRGYINPRSQIIVRMLTNKQEEIDEEFFRKRIEDAWQYRKRMLKEPDYCRLIFGEADFLPGLIVDKFGEYLVVQTLALGVDLRLDMILRILENLLQPKGIYERNDVPVRELEGLAQKKGFLKGEFPTLLTVYENGLPFYADVDEGQKTGFFYDQRENRLTLEPIVKGAKVLDCFCHTGSFAIHAAKYGAREVMASDISEFAIGLARKNAELNHVAEVVNFQVVNAFDLLRNLTEAKEQFDVVILDPPAFAKSRNALEGAARGYKEINLRGLRLVRNGGFLITCSCSYHMDSDLFLAIIEDAAQDVGRKIRQIEYRVQAKDHPILLSAPETKYLKYLMVQVID
jgi:23S rRNA (cytosine1962-C5)-methyltransferase